jgi:hypothetical protein
MTGRQRNGIDPNPHAEQRPEVGGATGTTRQPLAAEARKVEESQRGGNPRTARRHGSFGRRDGSGFTSQGIGP